MPAKRPPAATRKPVADAYADAYALGYWPGVSLLRLFGQSLLDPLEVGEGAGQSAVVAGLAAARVVLATAATATESAGSRLRQLAEQHGLQPAAPPTPTESASHGQVFAPPYRAWLAQVRRAGRALTARSQQDVFSLGEAVGDLQVALCLTQALLRLGDLSARLPQLATLAGEIEHARNNAAQRLILTLGSPQLPAALAVHNQALSAPLLGAPHGLGALSPAGAVVYAEWLTTVLALLDQLSASAAGAR